MTGYSPIRALLYTAMDLLWRAEYTAAAADRQVLVNRAYDLIDTAGTDLVLAEPHTLVLRSDPLDGDRSLGMTAAAIGEDPEPMP